MIHLIQMNLKSTILSDGVTQMALYYIIPFIMILYKEQNYMDRKQTNDCEGLGGRWRLTKSSKRIFWGDGLFFFILMWH